MTTSNESKPASAKRPDLSDRVTFLLFKDNKVARTLQVPVRWVNQLGIAVLLLALITAASLTWAVKITLRIKSLHPERVQELEDKILALEGDLKKAGVVVAQAPSIPLTPLVLLNKPDATPSPASTLSPSPSPVVVAAVAPAISPSPIKSVPSPSPSPVVVAAAPSPVAVAVVIPSPSPTPAIVMIPPLPATLTSVFFDLVPELKGKTPPDRATLAIEIDEPKARIKDRKLEVDFNIHYVGQDGSSQRGVILMIARGSNFVKAYPERLIRSLTPQVQIGIAKGEWFLVSRFRAVHGDFPGITSLDMITSIEILLLDGDLNPLLHEKFDP